MNERELTIRAAMPSDQTELTEMIQRSIRFLSIRDYTPHQVVALGRYVHGADPQLIDDGTLFVAEIAGRVVGCAAWSRRASLHGGSTGARERDPAREPAIIRNVFVDPNWARRGIARSLMRHCETECRAAGFQRIELLATLTGAPLYRALGYEPIEMETVDLGDGASVDAIRMEKKHIRRAA